ncbi:gag-Pol polyprotein [Trichonephila clavipes]|nr:gag-Pol polyprotein [Trichonephila clavipes]
MGKECDMFYACKGRSFSEFSHRACHNQNDSRNDFKYIPPYSRREVINLNSKENKINNSKQNNCNNEFGKITGEIGENVEAKQIKTAIALDNNSLNHPMDSLVAITDKLNAEALIPPALYESLSSINDKSTNFKSALTQEFTKRIGSSLRFSCPGYPASNGLVERWNKVLKDMIHHVIREDPRSWDRQLPFLLFAYREVPNTTTGVSPFRLLYCREARGPLAILKSSWAGEIHLPTNISQSAADYLQEMKINMEKAAESASLTAAQKQKAYGEITSTRSHL